jgi:hypothetical protein
MSDDIEATIQADQARKRERDEAERQRQERWPKVRLVNRALSDFKATLQNRSDASEEGRARMRGDVADAFITLARRLRAEGEDYRLDGLPSHGPKGALAESLYRLGRQEDHNALLGRLKELENTTPDFQSEVWLLVGELTGAILDTSEVMFGVPLFGKHATRAPVSASTDQTRGEATEGNNAQLDSTIQTILDKARTKQSQAVAIQLAQEEAEARFRRAHEAWLRLSNFRGDAIPREVTGNTLHHRYAELIVDLGRVLKADGWGNRLDAITPDTDAKVYAVAILRRAMENDIATVTTMVREGIYTVLHLGLEVDSWLRDGLMYEVLNIRPAPQPPLGWEGSYLIAVETVEDFVKWIDGEFLIHELVNRASGQSASDGQLVRNAFRLVLKLGLGGMPLEPTGPFTLNNELAVLRNLRRLSLERQSNRSARTEHDPTALPEIPIASDVPDLGGADTVAEFWGWCNGHRDGLRAFRVRLGEPAPTSVAMDEFRVIPEIVRQCRGYLLGFGAGEIPERFTFPALPADQTPAGPEHFPSAMEAFLAWASGYRAPGHGILRLIGEVEEFLTWAMRWAGQPQSVGGIGQGHHQKGGTGRAALDADEEDASDPVRREELIQQLEPAVRLAYRTFCYAESKANKRLEDREAYDLFKEEGISDGTGNWGELEDYRLPAFDSWARYLREARKMLNEPKYTRRAGRPFGKSIVKGDQVERLKSEDE